MKLAKLLKSLVHVTGALVAVAGMISFLLWRQAGRAGSTGIEQWIGRYLIGVIEQHITPALAWHDLDYQAPLTVVIDHPLLTTQGVNLLEIERLTLGLAEIPRRDQPVRIQRLDLQAPALQFVLTKDARLVGWSNFLRSNGGIDSPPGEPDYRLSDALRIRSLDVHDGRLVYEYGGANYEKQESAAGRSSAVENPLTLTGINLHLETPPDDADPGWYRIAGTAVREQLFDAGLDGRLNLDTGRLHIISLKLSAALDDRRYASFPPELQSFLRQYEIRGAMTLSLNGDVDVAQLDQADVRATLQLQDGSFLWHGARVTLDQLALEAQLSHGALVADYSANLFGGRSTGRVSAALNPSKQIEIAVRLESARAEQLVPILPRNLREALRDLSGPVTAKIDATLSPEQEHQDTWSVDAHFQDAILAWSQFRLPTRSAAVLVRLIPAPDSGRLQVTLDAKLPDGRVTTDFRSDLAPDSPIELDVRVDDVPAEGLFAFLPIAGLKDRIAGRISGFVQGTTRFSHWPESKLTGRIDLTDASIAIAHARLPIRMLQVSGNASDRVVKFRYEIGIFDGRGRGEGRISLVDDFPLNLDWTLTDAQLASIAASFSSQPSRQSARLQSNGRISAALARWPDTLDGESSITVDRARLMTFPLMSELTDAVRSAIPNIPLIDPILRPDLSDRGSIRFKINADHLDISEFEVVAALIAARGQGRVYYDGGLDLTLSAGPLKKLESFLGPIGDLLGKATDALLSYDVRGTLSSPQITLHPLRLWRR